jgi:hypothetical protein
LTLTQIPPGYRLESEPVIVYPAGGSVNQNLTLIPLGDILGQAYLDTNGNGVLEPNESGTDNYDIFLLDDQGSPPQAIPVAADGSFTIPDMQADVQYTLSTDLNYPGYGPPGAAISEAPGWFSVSNQNVEIRLGLFPWDPEDANFNVVLGTIYDQVGSTQQPMAGAEVGYFYWDNNTGCSGSNPNILDSTQADVNGEYRLDTLFLPGNDTYCLRVINLPGYEQVGVLAVPTNMHYQTPCCTVYQPRIDSGKNLQVNPISGLHAPTGGATVTWAAFLDTNLNGFWDENEIALPGVTLGDGTTNATSALDGFAPLTGLGNGSHTLTLTPPTGYAPVGPTSFDLWLTGADLSLPPTGFRLDNALTGFVFADNDGDHWPGTDERGMADVSVTLSSPVMTTTTTSPDGRFILFDLPDGQYTLSVNTPTGFATVPSQMLTLTNGGAVRVPLHPLGQVTGAVYEDWDGDNVRGRDEIQVANPITITLQGFADTKLFGGNLLFWDVPDGTYTLTPWWSAVEETSVTLNATAATLLLPAADPGIVRGTLWHDANADGLRQPWEVPIAGVTVTLDNAISATTDKDGRFIFANVPDGTHTLAVDLPTGLMATIPAFVTGERGTVVGVPAVKGAVEEGVEIFLPIVVRP